MDADKWELQLRKGIIELVIMLLVSKKPLYGYQITQTLNNIPQLQISDGSIYPILKRLEKNKWLYSFWEETERGGPRRKYYELTNIGEEVLSERFNIFNQSVEVVNSLKGDE